MTDYSIFLKPVYSRPAEALPKGVILPRSLLNLSWHQAATVEALKDDNVDVVFNTAMTSDGKSLSGYLLAMTERKYTLAMYPTNELARDQEKQVQRYKELFQPKYQPQINRLTARILEEFVITGKLPSKLEGLEGLPRISCNFPLLLTIGE